MYVTLVIVLFVISSLNEILPLDTYVEFNKMCGEWKQRTIKSQELSSVSMSVQDCLHKSVGHFYCTLQFVVVNNLNISDISINTEQIKSSTTPCVCSILTCISLNVLLDHFIGGHNTNPFARTYTINCVKIMYQCQNIVCLG